MRRLASAGAVLLAAALVVPASAAGEARATAFSVKAPAEVRTAPGAPWKPLKMNAVLPGGASVRTRAGGSVSVVFDRRLGGLAHLTENTSVEFLKSPDHLHLRSGTLFLVMEEEGPAAEQGATSAGLTVLTPDVRVHMGSGGCGIEASPRGTEIKVYGGRADVRPEGAAKRQARSMNAVDEGFKFFSGPAGKAPENGFERLRAADYADWQRWIRTWYEKKDDFEADVHEKDVARRKAVQKEET
ncbi:MAG TPA: hypothetical protein VL404_00275 [Candidatus Eisenbacteria bacterium]|nr:hypothetical protein [Candidatus Eisenbacteria bacterium]